MSIVDVKLAAECEKVHRQAMEYWREGSPVKIWKDRNEVLCIKYESGRWWHYRKAESGKIEWW